MMHLSRNDDIPDTYASCLIGIPFVIIVVRWLREASLCEDILVVRMARKGAIFDGTHRFVQVGASSTCQACIFIMRVRLAFLKSFVHRPMYLVHMAVGEGCATLTRHVKF